MKATLHPLASADALHTSAPITPGTEWLRPASVTFLGRSHLYNLMASGEIESVCLRRKGKTKGVRLISAESLRRYIASQKVEVAK